MKTSYPLSKCHPSWASKLRVIFLQGAMKVCLWTRHIQENYLKLLRMSRSYLLTRTRDELQVSYVDLTVFLAASYPEPQWDSETGIMRLSFWYDFVMRTVSSILATQQKPILKVLLLKLPIWGLDAEKKYFYYIPWCLFLLSHCLLQYSVSFSLSPFLLSPSFV